MYNAQGIYAKINTLNTLPKIKPFYVNDWIINIAGNVHVERTVFEVFSTFFLNLNHYKICISLSILKKH